MKFLSLIVLAAMSLALPNLAQADAGFVTADVNLRAGPDVGYPVIDQIRAGTDIDVQGCTSGWEWCDVIVYDERGWVAGNFIQYDYDNRTVLLPRYGAQIGIPIISFSIGNYWDSHYRGRPFYSQRSHWYRYRASHRSPPPARHAYRGPRHVNRGNGRSDHRPGYPGRHAQSNRAGREERARPGRSVHRVERSSTRGRHAEVTPRQPAGPTRTSPSPHRSRADGQSNRHTQRSEAHEQQSGSRIHRAGYEKPVGRAFTSQPARPVRRRSKHDPSAVHDEGATHRSRKGNHHDGRDHPRR